ncbi:hypothetical protein SCHPADRAFT_49146 [Schizopora paradoxa]|uniref:Uncharacterized protein n=1 Tax=Schizopora paradoxa TaxID=27342 RepID=A0A0H2SCX1_9AGAM|nr:hypothetical protein SCHPADRAFT_49146 [Schizopora paradoxa]
MRTNDLWLSPEIITPQNLPTVPPSISTPFYFPPSPPYTNSQLKHPVPLPCPVGCGCSSYIEDGVDESSFGMALIEEEDYASSASTSSESSCDLITPPSSPRSSSLELLDDQGDFDSDVALSLDRPPFEEPSQEWDQSSIDGVCLDNDDWDEPLFLNAPTAEREHEEPPIESQETDAPRDQWLPEPNSQSPLDSSSDSSPIHPSFFDVFKTDWDTISLEPLSMHNNVTSVDNSGYPQLSNHSSVQNPINPFEHSLFNEKANLSSGPHRNVTTQGDSHSYGLISPPSPSRRGTLSLPPNEGLAFEQQSNSRPSVSLTTSYLPDFSNPALSPLSQLTHSHPNLFDVPPEIFQSPLNASFDLPQPKSLLFAPNPEDVPLPPSPPLEIYDLSSDSDEDFPLALLEESRLRMLKQRYVAKEQAAKARDIALTDYIVQIASMQEPRSDAVYCAVPGGHMPMLLPPSPPQSMEDEGQAGPPKWTFKEMRAHEIQAAAAQRIQERLKRKRAKEKIRELTSLLALKSAHLRVTERPKGPSLTSPTSPPPPLLPPIDDFTTMDSFLQGVTFIPQRSPEELAECQIGQDVLHFVAKMFFKRRDSPRSLGARLPPTSPPRRYVRSSLSKEALVEGAKERKESDFGEGEN